MEINCEPVSSGLQSWNEMFIGFVEVADDPSMEKNATVHADLK